MITHEWSTDSLPVAGRFEAWQDALDQSHLSWRLDALEGREVSAQLHSRALGDARFMACRSAPCSGHRQKGQIARDTDAFFGLLYVREGRETVRDHRGERELRAGDLLFWDSRRVQDFQIHDRLDKLTLLVPQAKLDAVLPHAERYAGTVLRGPLARLVQGSLDTLLEVCDVLDERQARAAVDTTVQGLANALFAGGEIERSSGAPALMQSLTRYIETHLQTEDLGPRDIARANGISVRYLHLLFTRQGLSVARWIKQRRLLRVRGELKLRQDATITEIAHRWGFGDAAQLSRAFRAEFGCSPRVYRKTPG